jgi:hypothetical protein
LTELQRRRPEQVRALVRKLVVELVLELVQ